MIIKGKFVYLKSISLNDSLFIFRLRQKKLVSLYLHKPPKSVKDQKRWICSNIKNNKALDFIIVNKKKNKKIGTIGLNNIQKNSAEWGRWIAQGNSVQNIESVLLLLNYGFEKLKLKNIYSLTNKNNKKVLSFHNKTSAINKGLIKSYFIIKKKKIDAIKYSFTKINFNKFKKKFYLMTRSIQ